MKIILSRKGFDAGVGKVPSPIFPSGEMISLPIPEGAPNECAHEYTDIRMGDSSMGAIVQELTRGNIQPTALAHLDPDLNADSIPRPEGWKPVFGQSSAAESHLRKKNVGEGDIFVFFGWFRKVHQVDGRYRYVPHAPDLHVIFGWLQIEKRVPVAHRKTIPEWALGHPHCKYEPYNGNDSIYIAADKLNLPGYTLDQSGAGVFRKFHPSLCLTADRSSRSTWKLPRWFYPDGKKTTLSYHGDLTRWQRGDDVLLKTVGRGQEFILDCDDYPEAIGWLADKLCLSERE